MTLLHRVTRFALILALAVRANAQSSIDRSPGTVSILRDDWGVPHIFAAREEDGYFGLGYALAEDRLENVLRRYVAASSGLASIFGRDSLAKDLSRLQWMHMEAARNALRRFSPQLRRDYESFAEGIEQFMRDNPSRVPRWARNMRIDPALPIAWSRAWAFYWAEGVEECAAGGAPVNQQLLSAARDEGRAMPASNGWVVSPWRSEEGAAVLVGDSHSEFGGNGEMFEFHLDAGDIKVTGTSGVGVPWVIVGHTRAAAWTTTNRGYDGADCYVLQVHASNPRRYMHRGVWRTIQTREVSVRVKESAPVSHVFEYVEVNGLLNPVVARRGTQVWVVSDPYMDRAGESSPG
jgi:penicillin amidase